MLAESGYVNPESLARISREVLGRAMETMASQALLLAEEMEAGAISDRGGPDALRLLAALVRASGFGEHAGPVGHA